LIEEVLMSNFYNKIDNKVIFLVRVFFYKDLILNICSPFLFEISDFNSNHTI
jgi:hypothetical protein